MKANLNLSQMLYLHNFLFLTRNLFTQVSKAAAELMAYCEAHAKEDPLVAPVPSSENPFREKKLFCVVL